MTTTKIFRSPEPAAPPVKRARMNKTERKPLAERFWPKVQKTKGCWLWTGSLVHGYGQINPGGRGGQPLRAHRVSYEMAHGPIPKGLYVCHHCDNPACVNPAHLFLGTARTNAHDRDNKGRCRSRSLPGNTNGRRLTQEEVNSIRQAAARGIPQRTIAMQHRCTQGNVSFIVRGATWRT